MIYAVTTKSHQYTFEALQKAGAPISTISYPMLLTKRKLPVSTYIFTDFDRLSFWQLELVGRLAHQLAAAGCRVLNDPALVLQRLALLRTLRRAGVNSFQAWAAEEVDTVDRFPVFLRTQSAHRGVLTDLLPDPPSLQAALKTVTSEGHPLRDLMIVEYCAEPVKADLFRKLSIFKIGDDYVTAPCVHERRWTAKFGELGGADQELYDDDFRMVSQNTYVEPIRKAFEAANIDYGRADFGLVGAMPQLYEINTNPFISQTTVHPFPIRLKSEARSFEGVKGALSALNRPHDDGAVQIDLGAVMNTKSRRLRFFPGYQWMP